jgi:pSer/pThr/pTyr-binding forkhead associated (FHA) protein
MGNLSTATLFLLDDDGATAGRWDVGARPLAIGRGESADVIINDETLSRRHFIILREGDNYVLQDLGSHNGTWVGGQRALKERTRLHRDVCIVAGHTVFLFSEHLPAASTASEVQRGPHDTVLVSAAADAGRQTLASGLRPSA